MRNALLTLALLAGALFVAGCGNTDQSSATDSRSSGPAMTSTSTATASSNVAVAPATQPQPPPPPRNTTTQPLPAGWNYITEKDLAAGPLSRTPTN